MNQIWWVLCTLTFVALPLTIWEFSRVGYDIHWQSWFIGGLFVLLTFPIILYQVSGNREARFPTSPVSRPRNQGE
jgi:hypothetical protein